MKRSIPSILLAGYFLAALAAVGALAWNWRKHEAPVQPIAFPHPTHITKVGLACVHCHTTVEKSPKAGVPALSVCMECHASAAVDRPEIQKLTGYWERKEPVPWIRVHTLPWHVRFTHKRHIRAGVDCSVCHGELKAQARVRQVRSFQMGFCVHCHRQNSAPTDCWTCHK
jgi:hypothetical protein